MKRNKILWDFDILCILFFVLALSIVMLPLVLVLDMNDRKPKGRSMKR